MKPSLSPSVAYTSLWRTCLDFFMLLDCGFLCEEICSEHLQQSVNDVTLTFSCALSPYLAALC